MLRPHGGAGSGMKNNKNLQSMMYNESSVDDRNAVLWVFGSVGTHMV